MSSINRLQQMISFENSFRHPRPSIPLRIAILAVICAFGLPLFAQTPDDDVISITTSLVQLNVGVVDRQGQPILNLSPSDFSVYEDGVKQTITRFEPVDAPFSLVLMLDVSGSTSSFRPNMQQSAFRLIDALTIKDRVCVIAFSEKAEVLADFTSDYKRIAWAIQQTAGSKRPTTNLYSALNVALEKLRKETNRRKAIVVLTDGLDTEMRSNDRTSAARAQTNDQAVASINPNAAQSLNSVLDAADKLGATIYPLALPSGDPKRLPIQTPSLIAIYSAARSRLQTLADRTGGRLNEIRRLEDMGRLYAEVAADLRTLYSIAYQLPGEKKRDGKWRSIRIDVNRQAVIARTRPGYFAK